MTPDSLLAELDGRETGAPLALALAEGVGLGLSDGEQQWAIECDDPGSVVAEIDGQLSPRWVWWDRSTPEELARHSVTVDRCWDVLTVHRLLHGGWKTSIPLAWAWLNDLSTESLPRMGQLGLLDAASEEGDNAEDPLRPDGHLRPEWATGGWTENPDRMARWASLAFVAHDAQLTLLGDRDSPERALMTARSESAAEMLCAELERDGLPIDEGEARRIIAQAEEERADELVLRHLQPSQEVNLRNPAEVKTMLRRAGLDLPDTRAWRLEKIRDSEPLVDALLTWRKAERIATTYGTIWLAEHVAGGRLRGEWTSSDGAAGRMTASAGLHNLPAPMRTAIAPEASERLVRADLGQIEPRVLAAVSGDEAFVAATQDDDLYQPVAQRLGVTREVAKVAILGAMYGATTGESAGALRGLQNNYPIAMGLLEEAAEAGRLGHDVFTTGGRRVPMWVDPSVSGDIDKAISVAAARGRFARNALIQGAAAEFFKVWAITVRRRVRHLGARIVLCLHDELLVLTPIEHADEVAALVAECVQEAAHYWSPDPRVRFVADVSIVKRWSDAKD
ncbi:MAG: DNA polymerase I [Acidimicrobiales bacterium]|nr:MAG: DNA polymerase I [Acidimicrobiales bacterium]